ncbi:hypothetical protein HAX54_012814 [Datura stramonium]|uniref:Myb/SANT-like DNA-binding domain-containing protein n=1 Tax=Datura stramonium TaxID=4076 RepID=A0ABS8TN50_DATST|nr:hypothetical protein [Datura stramonium]
MEGNLSSGNMMAGNSSYGGFDFQGSTRANHQQLQHYQSHSKQGSMVHPTINANFPLTIGSMQDCNQNISLVDYNKGDRGKSASDEDEPSFTEDDPNRGKKTTPWQRVKWTDQMVRLLITAVSYIGEETAAEYGGRRKCSNLHKKGKWKSVSKVMAERGHFVSPQQCEDKFNDLNKRYKRLNEILVENPALLDMLDHVSEKGKEEVRKILSSKHLHYEEMCSYHNGNRLHLPPDPELQRSLRLALKSRDEHDDNDIRNHLQDDNDEEDHEADLEDRDEYEENNRLHGMSEGFSKRIKQCQGHETVTFGNSLTSLDCNRTLISQPQPDAHQVFPEGNKADILQKQWMDHRLLQLEEQKLQIQAQMLELEKERFNWQRFSRKKDIELEVMRMENERMKLENERMALELKRKEMLADNV